MGTLGLRPLTALDLKRIVDRLAPWQGRRICELFAGKAGLSSAVLKLGAENAFLVEKDKRQAFLLKKKWRDDSRVRIWQLDFRIAIKRIEDHGWQFELVLIDPPFGEKLLAPAVKLIAVSSLVVPEGYMVVKSSPTEWTEPGLGWEPCFTIKHSDIWLGAWQRKAQA
jgi:16S rRNA (guanine966-N2)-methyltransferase